MSQPAGASWFRHPASGDGQGPLWEPFASFSTNPLALLKMLFRFGVRSNRDDQASEFANNFPIPPQN